MIIPDPERVESLRDRLPNFTPLAFIDLARSTPANGSAATKFLQAKDRQVGELLRALGLRKSDPNVWQRAFLALASVHHQVGHVSHRISTNRNASKWFAKDDDVLLHEVAIAKDRGLSERDALRAIAADPVKRLLFPYSRQKQRHYPKQSDVASCMEALKGRMWHLKHKAKSTNGRSATERRQANDFITVMRMADASLPNKRG